MARHTEPSAAADTAAVVFYHEPGLPARCGGAGSFGVVPGEMGAPLIRRDWGETLDDMAQNFS